MAQTKLRKRAGALGILFLTCAAFMTGCTSSEPPPSGQASFDDAEANYLRYRGFVNELQSTLSVDDWTIGQLGV